jgi:hypothetical protein
MELKFELSYRFYAKREFVLKNFLIFNNKNAVTIADRKSYMTIKQKIDNGLID